MTLYGIAIKSIEDYTKAQVEENKEMEDLSGHLQDVVNKISEIGINNGDKDNQGEQIKKKYIEDKLIARYDGIENTREGHKDNATIWEDISGNNRDLIMYNSGITKTVFWEEDGLVNVEESVMCLKTNLIPELQTLKSETIEIVLYCAQDGTNVTRDVINTISANYQPWSGAGVNLSQNQLLEVYNHDNGGTVIPKAYNFDNCKKVYVAVVLEEYNNGNGYTKLYINGKEYSKELRKGEMAAIQDINANHISMFNFSPSATKDNSFVGKIYSARVYGKALSTEEIKNNYDLDNKKYKIEEKVNTKIAGYVQDNLFAQYDGIINTREGHRSVGEWEDISGNNRDLTMYNYGLGEQRYWEKDGIVQTTASTMYMSSQNIPEICNFTEGTLEVLIRADEDGTTNSRDIFGIIGRNTLPYIGSGICLGTGRTVWGCYYDRNMEDYMTTSLRNEANCISIVAEPYNNGNGKKKVYVNGVECESMQRYGEKFYIQDTKYSNIWMFNITGTTWIKDISNSFIGKIYAARIYDRALSSEEIQKNYNTDKARFGI
ncbi:MAG: hypothetical protein HFJ51_03520 [Clostridia bacterium]|nr:hypothetical protein [Clostridia bacterium]